jgi:hypothetical protein
MNRAFTMPSIVVRRMASYMTGMKRILSVLLLVALVAGLSLIWVQRKADPPVETIVADGAQARDPRALLPEARKSRTLPISSAIRLELSRKAQKGAPTPM